MGLMMLRQVQILAKNTNQPEKEEKKKIRYNLLDNQFIIVFEEFNLSMVSILYI
jgi:hypothetical protein